jgi:NAD(P)-dependent dehydrogenase (short-subunit alcohol dehydrogenase family)
MENKVILITGSTDGIGKITAQALAKQGHTVIIHGRNEEKTKQVYEEIKSKTGNKKIDYIIADLLSLSDIKRMTNEFKKRYTHLDVLINNAGAIFGKNREITNEGFEKTITLNLFAPFLLTNLLLETLTKSKSARIINLYSAMHRRSGKPDFNNFQSEKVYRTDKAYGLSKLYLVWITQHLAKILKEKGITNVTVNACHPGAVATSFGQEADKGFLMNLIFKVALKLMPKPETGAKTSIYLATSSEVENISGQFFDQKMKVEKPDHRYYSAENEQLVWDYCEKIIQPYLKNLNL